MGFPEGKGVVMLGLPCFDEGDMRYLWIVNDLLGLLGILGLLDSLCSEDLREDEGGSVCFKGWV